MIQTVLKTPLFSRSEVKSRSQRWCANDRLPRAQWAVVESKDQEPVAFYFDVNADGKLSDEEKSLPVPPPDLKLGFSCAFITSDFILRTQDQREIPFRYILVGISSNIPYQWGPFCVLEGQTNLTDEPTELVLYPDKLDGYSFTAFGSSSYALFPAGQKVEGYRAHYRLSSLIEYKGTFYRLTLDGVHEKGKTVHVAFEKDPKQTGQWAVALKGKETLTARLGTATVNGAEDDSIDLDTHDTPSSLPEGRYRLSSALIGYGVQKDSDRQATFVDGPVFEIRAGQTRQIEAGDLTLSVRAVNESDRNRPGVKERSVFAQGTPIFLVPQIKGKGGEVYTRFSQKNQRNDFVDVSAHIMILDANGKTVASADMPYT